jgi:transcriptional regulator with XRE-family HTH domain
MQEESAEKWSQGERLKFLRIKRQCNWADIAKDIGLSEGMIYAVIAGKKFLSDKAVWRLAELERAAGIEPPVKASMVPGSLREAATPPGTAQNSRLKKIRSDVADVLEQIIKVSKALAELDEAGRGQPADGTPGVTRPAKVSDLKPTPANSGKSPAAKSAAALAKVAALRKTAPAK